MSPRSQLTAAKAAGTGDTGEMARRNGKALGVSSGRYQTAKSLHPGTVNDHGDVSESALQRLFNLLG